MANTSNVQVSIAFKEPDLDDDELEEMTQNLFNQMRQLDEIEDVKRVQDPNPREGSMALGGFLLGILTAEINAKNVKALMKFLGERLSGKMIEMEVEANGRKLKVKVGSQQELFAAIKAAEQFVEGGN